MKQGIKHMYVQNTVYLIPDKKNILTQNFIHGVTKNGLSKADTVSFSAKGKPLSEWNTLPEEEVLNKLGMKILKTNKYDMFTINEYRIPESYRNKGIDEDRLFLKIRKIMDSADFRGSNLTDLGSLEIIGGNAWFDNSKITRLDNLRTIGGSACFDDSKIIDLGNLNSIGGEVYYDDSKLNKVQKAKLDKCSNAKDNGIKAHLPSVLLKFLGFFGLKNAAEDAER